MVWGCGGGAYVTVRQLSSLASFQTHVWIELYFLTCAEKSTRLSLSPELFLLLRCFSSSALRHRRSLPW